MPTTNPLTTSSTFIETRSAGRIAARAPRLRRPVGTAVAGSVAAMSRITVRHPLVLTVLTAVALPASAQGATVEIGKTKIVRVAGFDTTDPTGKAARKAFGAPTGVDQRYGGNTCVVSWRRLGLSIVFGDLSGSNDACGDGGLADTVVIKGAAGAKSFQTNKGLRVGQSVTRLRKLYPRASRHGSSRWLATGRSFIGDCSPPSGCAYPIAEARTARGRVSSLRLVIGAAGD